MTMATKLRDMQQHNSGRTVAVGGVIGAMHFDATLDITAPPRLDLCVNDGDISFMSRLDAGLELDVTSKGKAVVVIHVIQDSKEYDMDATGRLVASPFDCLTDLLEMGLVSEARDFAHNLNRRAARMRDQRSSHG